MTLIASKCGSRSLGFAVALFLSLAFATSFVLLNRESLVGAGCGSCGCFVMPVGRGWPNIFWVGSREERIISLARIGISSRITTVDREFRTGSLIANVVLCAIMASS